MRQLDLFLLQWLVAGSEGILMKLRAHSNQIQANFRKQNVLAQWMLSELAATEFDVWIEARNWMVPFELAAQFPKLGCWSLMNFDSRAKPESKIQSNQTNSEMAANQTY